MSGDCKHYNGFYVNERCGAGVPYASVIPDFQRPGAFWRKPCQKLDDACNQASAKHAGQRGECPCFEPVMIEDVTEGVV